MYWQPPKPALEKVEKLVWEPSVSRYGADEGLPELREALTKKVFLNTTYNISFMIHMSMNIFLCFLLYWQLREENKLCKSSVMVTAGANQVARSDYALINIHIV